jgi:hypothetical protein
MPEQLDRPDGQWVDAVTLHQSLDYGHTSGDVRVDDAGNQYEMTLFAKWNATIAYLRKYAPNGAVLAKWNIVCAGAPHDTNYQNPAWNGSGKIDEVQMCPTGRFMLVKLYAHNTNAERQNPVAQVLLDVGFVQFGAGQNPEFGGYPTYAPDPAPEVEVDYERVERIVNFVVERIVGAAQNDSLVNKITMGQGSMRQQLRALGKQATRELLTETDADAEQYKAALFQFVKNANAGVQANILGGQDAWGQARRDELKEIIREVLREGDPA